jgi:ribosomal protein L40E
MRFYYTPDPVPLAIIQQLAALLGRLPTAKEYAQVTGVSRSRAYRDIAITKSPLFGAADIDRFVVLANEVDTYIMMRVEKYNTDMYVIGAELGISNEAVRKRLANMNKEHRGYRVNFPACVDCGTLITRQAQRCRACYVRSLKSV